MSKIALNTENGKALFENVCMNPDKLPFSFTYDQKVINSASDFRIQTNETVDFITKEMSFPIDDLQATYVCKFNKEFGQIEYYAYIENTGDSVSKPISSLTSLDICLEGINPVVRGNYGDLGKYYEAYENRLDHGDMRFKQDDGRACHIMFPYFDLCCGNGGVMIALGWAGTWEALFTTGNSKTHVMAKTCLKMNASLLPKEKIRTALVVLLPYKGRNEDNATNLWREWYVKYNMPKNIKPFTTCMLANDTGVPNYDGSVSESHLTYKASIDKLVEEKLVTDYRWVDAGWYIKPNLSSSKDDWWGSVGAYDVDHYKWPDNSFREAVEYCHNLGMKTFLWFEPERVSDVESLCKNFGYKKEWAFETPHAFYNNIGNPDCFSWTVNRIINALESTGADMYREDNNQTPGFAFDAIDEWEEKTLGIKRRGVNENKCVLAHYKLLDTIIDYQIKNGKSTFVDICAGGGGRNDIESLRRGIPVMRSDVDRGTSSMRLSQSSTLVKWIVFHGSSTKESDCTYKLLETKGASTYVARASYLPIFNLNEAFTHNANLDFDQIRRNVSEWKSINHLLTKDFYRLTPFRHNTNKTAWNVFCYDNGIESVLLGFRMEDCAEETYNAVLPYVKEDSKYTVFNADTNDSIEIAGYRLLHEGITLKLEKPKSSILLRIKQK